MPWLSVSASFCSGFKSLRDSDGVDQLSSGQGVARPTRLHAMGKQVPQRNPDVLLPEKKGGKQAGRNSSCLPQRSYMKRFQLYLWPISHGVPTTHTVLSSSLFPIASGSCPAHSGTHSLSSSARSCPHHVDLFLVSACRALRFGLDCR